MSDENSDAVSPKLRCRLKDPRKAHKVSYFGKTYTDITEFYTESFHNGDDIVIPSRGHVNKGGKNENH